MRPVDIINHSRPRIVNKLIFFLQKVPSPMLVTSSNIITHPITQDQLINLKSVRANGTLLVCVSYPNLDC